MQFGRMVPMWQRIVCGLLCVGGLLALPFNAVHGAYRGWHFVVQILSGAGGFYLFGHTALYGRLPGKLPGTKHVRFRLPANRRDT